MQSKTGVQDKKVKLFYFILFTPIVAALFLSLLVANYKHVDFSIFTCDVIDYADIPLYTGWLSYVGILMMAFSGAICIFTSLILAVTDKKSVASFFLYSGCLTLFVMADDLFMFHDSIAPGNLHIPENVVYVGYLTAIIIFIWKYFRYIKSSMPLLLLVGIAFFLIDIVADVQEHFSKMTFIFVEKGSKLLGITSWVGYFLLLAFREVDSVLKKPSTEK